MDEDRRRVFALPFAVSLLTFPGCNADGTPSVVATAQPGADLGGVRIDFSPVDLTFQAEQARVQTGSSSTEYRLLLDGRLVMLEEAPGDASPLTVVEGGMSALGYLDAGPHHFTISRADGHHVFEGDGQVASGGVTRLLLFGPLEALSGRFVSTPSVPSTGNEHVTVVDLMANQQLVEVVSCVDATTCTPLSPALSLSDVFDTELPAVLDGSGTSLTAMGAGVGYRLVPTDELPAPPVVPLYPQTASVAVFFAAPVYMSDDGQPQECFN
jgi:hypothetical protein